MYAPRHKVPPQITADSLTRLARAPMKKTHPVRVYKLRSESITCPVFSILSTQQGKYTSEFHTRSKAVSFSVSYFISI